MVARGVALVSTYIDGQQDGHGIVVYVSLHKTV